MYAEIKATLQEEEVVQSAETPQTVHTQRRSLFFYCILVAGFPSEGCYRKLPPGVRSAKECFFFFSSPPSSPPPSPPTPPPPASPPALSLAARRRTQTHTPNYMWLWILISSGKKKIKNLDVHIRHPGWHRSFLPSPITTPHCARTWPPEWLHKVTASPVSPAPFLTTP